MTSGKGSICQIGANPYAHGQVINLAAIEPLKEGPAGATTTNQADVKGKIVQYFCYMEKQGYAETTTQTYFQILEMLQRNSANLNDPESVKEVIAKHHGQRQKMEHRQSLHIIPKNARSQLGKTKILSNRKNSANTTETTNNNLIADQADKYHYSSRYSKKQAQDEAKHKT